MLKTALCIVGALAAGLLAFFGVNWWMGSGDLAEVELQRRLAREEGLPLEADDLRPKPSVPDEDNAAIPFREALKLVDRTYGSSVTPPLKKEWEAATKYVGTEFGFHPLKVAPGAAQRIAELLRPLDRPLELIRSGSERPRCDWRRMYEEGVAMLLPEYAPMRQAVRILAASAYVRVEKGDSKGAFAELLACARIARLLREEPVLIAQLVSAMIERHTLEAYRAILGGRPSDPFWLRAGEKLLSALGPPLDVRRALFGEVVMMRVSLDKMSSLEGLKEMGFRDEDLVWRRPNAHLRNRTEAILLREARAAVSKLPKDPTDYESARKALRPHGRTVEEALGAFFYAFDALGSGGGPHGDGPWADIATGGASALTQRRITQAFVAALDQAAKSGSAPCSLPLSGKDGIDPFGSGNTLRYRKTEDGFVVYGVGPNGLDEGGPAAGGRNQGDDIGVAFPIPKKL